MKIGYHSHKNWLGRPSREVNLMRSHLSCCLLVNFKFIKAHFFEFPSFIMHISRPDFSEYLDRASRARSPHFHRARRENHDNGKNCLPSFLMISAYICNDSY